MTNVNSNKTPFSIVYDNFLAKITDDMYMELTELETFKLLQDLLISAIPYFEFPRVDINDYEINEIIEVAEYNGIESDYKTVKAILYSGGHFNVLLTVEEINILSMYMVVEWMSQQIASVENTRMKYSGRTYLAHLFRNKKIKFWKKTGTLERESERKARFKSLVTRRA